MMEEDANGRKDKKSWNVVRLVSLENSSQLEMRFTAASD